ncbi:MAG: transcriptional regulator BetI [Pseudomonadota bacterium]
MPKQGMEPLRRASLVDAALAEIGRTRTLDVTVGQIAKRAGVSSALAHHYFGSKDRILLAAMRHLLRRFGAAARAKLQTADTPSGRLDAILAASFAPDQFGREVVAAWLNFYVLAQTSPEAQRLLRLYHRRLRSNLAHALRPLVGARAPAVADAAASLIDGIYIGQALNEALADADRAAGPVQRLLDREIAAGPA